MHQDTNEINLKLIGKSVFLNNINIFNSNIIIKQIVRFKNIIVILEEYNPMQESYFKKINYANVFAIDFEGNQIWRIEKIDLKWKYARYNNIYILDGKLYAGNFSGHEMNLDPKTGKIIEIEFNK